ncbi:hypothetical protein EXIGLDRAFT_265997 [Exidia glandulosa HHB12029]|uniref:Uncharacterized protein n=1 Tax=Exidia glandulosa HHB12029 TaxID=1314781 RepID=A0A165M9V1_EXIGL|nr:hypothetical protein EXIGLDRAFT_265997 [Exidia glandulosa HHB12029]
MCCHNTQRLQLPLVTLPAVSTQLPSMGLAQSKQPRSRAQAHLRHVWQKDDERRRSLSIGRTRTAELEAEDVGSYAESEPGTGPILSVSTPTIASAGSRPLQERQQTGFSLSSATAVYSSSELDPMALNAKVSPAAVQK